MIDEKKRDAIKEAIRSAMTVKTGVRGGGVITLPPVFVKSEPPEPHPPIARLQ